MTGNKKSVLLIHRFFYPDSPPYATILRHLATVLQKEDYRVEVLSSQPSYKSDDLKKKKKIVTSQKNGLRIYRLPVVKLSMVSLSRIINFFWFPLAVLCFLLFRKKYDIISVSTNPPIILAFMVALAAKLKRCSLIYHCMDIHPEVGKLSGEFANKSIYRLFLKMDLFTCRTASKIVVLSKDMKKSLLERDEYLSEKVEIINNYNLSSGKVKHDKYFEDDGKKRVVFTGNIGRFQGLEVFVASLLEYGCIEGFELIFVGEGNALKKLKAQAKSLECVRFIPHQPLSIARKIIQEADMGIVSLQKDVIYYAYPSKTMAYLAEGTPILLSVEHSTEIAQFVDSKKLGVRVDGHSREKIHKIFKKLVEEKLNFNEKLIQETFRSTYSRDIFDKRFLSMLSQVTERK